MRAGGRVVAAGLVAASPLARAYDLDLGNADSIKSVAKDMAQDMMSFYTGNQPGQTPGLLPQPYYWWEAGALMGALVDYWYYTGDTTWNDITTEGLLFQAGPHNDYMPPNQTMTEGNDDQGFWAMAAMSAAEYKFPNPPASKPQWLALAQAVFNTQAGRWDEAECGGGLRWQIFTWNNGFDYKNSISQACFFNLAARLALYTGNQSYAAWADKTWAWMEASAFMSPNGYYIYDGAHVTNCSDITPYQWTYNAGAFLLGAAAMYNFTTSTAARETWHGRIDALLNGSAIFFQGKQKDIMTEVACEAVDLCDLDQQSFKAYLSRWMAATTKWAPWTYARIKPLLAASAQAAAATCLGGGNGRMCGLRWTEGRWDGSQGVGQQMAAMEVVLANMITQVDSPVTNGTGGTSVGDPGAGGSDVGRTQPWTALETMRPITATDRAGAWLATVAILLLLTGGCVMVAADETASGGSRRRRRRHRRNMSAKERLSVWWRRSSGSGGGGDAGAGVGSEGEDAGGKDSDKGFVIKTHEFLGADEANGGGTGEVGAGAGAGPGSGKGRHGRKLGDQKLGGQGPRQQQQRQQQHQQEQAHLQDKARRSAVQAEAEDASSAYWDADPESIATKDAVQKKQQQAPRLPYPRGLAMAASGETATTPPSHEGGIGGGIGRGSPAGVGGPRYASNNNGGSSRGGGSDNGYGNGSKTIRKTESRAGLKDEYA